MSSRYQRPYADVEEVQTLIHRTRHHQHTDELPHHAHKNDMRSHRHFPKEMFMGHGLWAMFLGGGVIILLFLYGPPTIQYTWDQWHYGDARISESFYDVGHNGISRFLASYSNGYIYITEYSHNADPDHELTYTFQIPGNDQVPRIVSLEKRVMHRHQNLIVYVEGITVEYVLYNTGTAFQVIPNQEER